MRALVLGGGGLVGVAWETGLVTGLAEGGIDLRDADLIVGTSAGSIVGTRLAAGQDLREAAVGSEVIPVPYAEGGPDLDRLREVFGLWAAAGEMTEALCAEIGALALSARTADPEAWIDSAGRSPGVEAWPERTLRLTAVDAKTGRFAVHDRNAGATLPEAIAASCAVPGMFPPVPIAGRRYMDGGVRSGTNADVALDVQPTVALVIAPICSATAVFGPLAERCMNDEIERLGRAGTRVCSVIPGPVEVEAFGPNLMDPARTTAAREAGHARGRALAREEAAIWLS
jgi:NTE family protein